MLPERLKWLEWGKLQVGRWGALQQQAHHLHQDSQIVSSDDTRPLVKEKSIAVFESRSQVRFVQTALGATV